jgi:hypothetical protein
VQVSNSVETAHPLLSARQIRSHSGKTVPRSRLRAICLVGLVLSATLPFFITLNAPLLHDSYAHVTGAATERLRDVLTFFWHPSANDLFFRPLGYISYWIDFKWAGYEPGRWHIWNLVFHAANTFLVYILSRSLSFPRLPSIVSTLIFAIHGSRPEVVSWTAARFDLLAAFFVLLTLIALNRHLATHGRRWRVAMIFCAVLALLSKESAYCLPLLAIGMLPFKSRCDRKEILRYALILLGIASILFVYRCWISHGIGGYRGMAGGAAVLQFSTIRSMKALLFRQWAFLFFPINWSTDLSVWLKIGVVLMLLVMFAFVLYSKPDVKLVFACVLIVLFADFPVHHLLLMTADLAGARVLYLPVLGVALFWGILLEGCKPGFLRVVLASGLLLFHLAALCHNLMIWREVAFLSQTTCIHIGAELRRDRRAIVVADLPATWHGVFFLRNAFPQCVSVTSKQNVDRLYLYDEAHPAPLDARFFQWSSRTAKLEEISR